MDRQPKIAKKEQKKTNLVLSAGKKKIVKVDEYKLYSQLHQKPLIMGGKNNLTAFKKM